MINIKTLKKVGIQQVFYCAFQKSSDGDYIAAPERLLGAAFYLDGTQFEEYERWFIEKLNARRPSRKQKMIAIVALLPYFAVAVLWGLDVITTGAGAFLLLPWVFLLFWLTYKIEQRETRKMMETFPFSNAPIAHYDFRARLKRYLNSLAALRLMKWTSWFVLGFGVILLVLTIRVTIVIFPEMVEPSDLSYMWKIVGLVCAVVISWTGFHLALILLRHRFKKRTGNSMSLKALYLDELGREPDFEPA